MHLIRKYLLIHEKRSVMSCAGVSFDSEKLQMMWGKANEVYTYSTGLIHSLCHATPVTPRPLCQEVLPILYQSTWYLSQKNLHVDLASLWNHLGKRWVVWQERCELASEKQIDASIPLDCLFFTFVRKYDRFGPMSPSDRRHHIKTSGIIDFGEERMRKKTGFAEGHLFP